MRMEARPPDMEGSCECTESAADNGWSSSLGLACLLITSHRKNLTTLLNGHLYWADIPENHHNAKRTTVVQQQRPTERWVWPLMTFFRTWVKLIGCVLGCDAAALGNRSRPRKVKTRLSETQESDYPVKRRNISEERSPRPGWGANVTFLNSVNWVVTNRTDSSGKRVLCRGCVCEGQTHPCTGCGGRAGGCRVAKEGTATPIECACAGSDVTQRGQGLGAKRMTANCFFVCVCVRVRACVFT